MYEVQLNTPSCCYRLHSKEVLNASSPFRKDDLYRKIKGHCLYGRLHHPLGFISDMLIKKSPLLICFPSVMLKKECSKARTCVETYLPSYDEAMKVNEYQDLMRLPTYQFRQLRRYHPYLRFVCHDEPASARYFNTIYDDERVNLEIPSEPCQQISSNSAAAVGDERHNQRPISQDGPPNYPNTSEGNRDLESLIQRLSSVMTVFAAAVKRANDIYEAECQSAIGNTPDPDPSLQSSASCS